jgi:glutamate-5-semialdehyde dehydrogenase
VLLRGGSETLHTNKVLVAAIQKALVQSGLPAEAVQLIAHPSRAYVKELLRLDGYVDMIIPRGGAALHRFCLENSTVPVITGGIGICHLFVEKTADLPKSIDVIINAKTSRPSVCNALDTLLVERTIAPTFLPTIVQALKEKGVSFRLDPHAWKLLEKERKESPPLFLQANEDDWKTEWLSLVLGIKVVDSLEEAIAHIARYGSGHSDGILTESKESAAHFVNKVDSASLYINASTRFTDGGQYGLGAEVAISTQKLHARGPMGLRELTTYKWIVEGHYHVRA